MAEDAIVMRGVRKTFGPKVAVEGIDLRVPRGSLTGFIGPNGAGKTTTIRMIMSILFPDSGELSVLGRRSALESKDRIGYLPEERGVYKKMKVGAFLTHIGRLKGLDRSTLRRRVPAWLEKVGLPEVARKRCEELSKGMQQKVQFISAVLHEPELIILDEPFSGLDPVNMRLLRDLVREQHGQGRTMIFCTHVMFQAEQLCDHVVMIHDGRKVIDESIAELHAAHEPRSVRFRTMSPGADVSGVAELPMFTAVAPVDGEHEALLAEGADHAAAVRAIAQTLPVARVELRRPTLEDIFIGIVQGTAASADERQRLRAALRSDAPAEPIGTEATP